MRILQISSATNFGGGEKHFVDLCRGLTKKGHEVFVAVRSNADWLKQLSFLPEENFFYVPLQNSLDIFSALDLSKIIREREIEIVHAHLARDYSIAALAVRFSKLANLVLTRHVFFRLNSLHKILLPKTTTFIAPTKKIHENLLQQNLVLPGQIHLIYNGIDVEYFSEVSEKSNRTDLCKQLNLLSEKTFVGIVGEITAHKGQTDFVRAAKLISKDFPETEFLIVGQDSSPQKTHQIALEKLIRELNLRAIHLLGFRKDVAPLYSLLDVFVSASRVEPFGLVIAEASASGCPVVATATDGATEIIVDGETGKLVPIKDAKAIAQAVGELLHDVKKHDEFIRKARLRIEKYFSLEEMIFRTENLYKNLSTMKSERQRKI